ncbi:MAG: thioesterase [Rhizobiaceae bacterium MnEN-MB40S]|nr:MAG: thioesterase [Rhizobiaceae bacterium MnEN-MB40S]
MTRPSPYTRSDFQLFRPLQTRWSDNDIYGHMNNVVHYLLFDTAVNGWLIDRGLLDIRNGDTIGLVVETGCQYFREIMFPDSVSAGIRVARLGNSSVTYEVGLFANEDDGAAAQGRFVHVYVDRETRRPKPLPDDWRTSLEEICV